MQIISVHNKTGQMLIYDILDEIIYYLRYLFSHEFLTITLTTLTITIHDNHNLLRIYMIFFYFYIIRKHVISGKVVPSGLSRRERGFPSDFDGLYISSEIHQKYDTWYIYRTFTNQIYNLKAVLKYSFSGFSREIFDRNVL